MTKYDNVDPLLHLPHNGHTRFRFSVNTEYVVRNFEPPPQRSMSVSRRPEKLVLQGIHSGLSSPQFTCTKAGKKGTQRC